MGARFSTVGVRSQEQFGVWQEEVSRRFGAHAATICRTPRFDASIDTAFVGTVSVSDIAGAPVLVTRTERDIARCEMDIFTVGLLLKGSGVVAQRGRTTRFGPGDLILSDARSPYQIRFDGPYRQLVLAVERSRLEARLPDAARRTAIRVDGRSGPGHVAAACVQAMREQAPHLGLAEEALGECAVDLMALAFGGEPLKRGPAGDAGSELVLDRVKAFIEAFLPDPQLSPDFIAHQHGISRRYLYGLFQNEGETVAGYIWQRRLAHCRDALADPQNVGRNISEIAFQWGYNDASHFCRAFSRAFGVSPRKFRLQHTRKTTV
jgi:AraC-like DNA-binding protein